MSDRDEVRRTLDGTIDVTFYAARARRLRTQARAELYESMRTSLYTSFRSFCAWRRSSSNGDENIEVSPMNAKVIDQ